MSKLSEKAKTLFYKAKEIKGKDPKIYRQDPYGNCMYLHSFGKRTPMGWEKDHINPQSKGGTSSIRNLQALNWKVNASKGNTLVKKSRHSKRNK